MPIYTIDQVFLGGSVSRESACNAGDLGSIPELGRSPGGGYGNPLQYSCLENSAFPSDIDSSNFMYINVLNQDLWQKGPRWNGKTTSDLVDLANQFSYTLYVHSR